MKEVNFQLSEENLDLKNKLEKTNINKGLDSLRNLNFSYKNAKVISNNLSSFKNKIIINKGSNDGVKSEMGVISSNGIVGIINNTTPKFSSIMSILNIEMKINAKVKRTKHFGTLEWDGFNTRHLMLNDISETANIKVGDTIVTGGMNKSWRTMTNSPGCDMRSSRVNDVQHCVVKTPPLLLVKFVTGVIEFLITFVP